MDDVVQRYYDSQVEAEWERLATPYRRLELISTLQLVDEYFPNAGHVADVGGGPGRYTIELLRRGYRVTLVDLSENAIAFVRDRLAAEGLRAEALHHTNAQDLSMLATSSFDAALLLGPLYHLIAEADRALALSELHRVLKPGAPAIVGFINPWGVLRAGLTEFPSFYTAHNDAASLLHTYVKRGEQPAFTESIFLPPPQALQELRGAGFAIVSRAGVEGFASGALDAVERIATEWPDAYDTVCRLVAETCQQPAYRDATEHLHAVVRCLK